MEVTIHPTVIMPGGVCAVLDYEVDHMAEYVAEMAMRIVIPNSSVTPAFRKFVSQILTSTRLPSTTILLGMNFLAKRINMLNAQHGHFKAPEGQVWRMLTVSLLLGSKFLDDNTFQNRSWSEVSGIPVGELNQIEFEWLKHINWQLYVNLDESNDYTAWLKNWAEWSDNKKHQQQVAQLAQQQTIVRERLAPIITNIQPDSRRSHGLAYQGWSPEEMHDAEAFNTRLVSSAKAYRQRENAWSNQYQGAWAQAPLTPPDSGYGTPEYLNSAHPANSRFDWSVQAGATGNYNRGYQGQTQGSYGATRGAVHYPQSYYHHYPQAAWDANLAECNCHNCMGSMHQKNNYYMPNAYGQAVMG